MFNPICRKSSRHKLCNTLRVFPSRLRIIPPDPHFLLLKLRSSVSLLDTGLSGVVTLQHRNKFRFARTFPSSLNLIRKRTGIVIEFSLLKLIAKSSRRESIQPTEQEGKRTEQERKTDCVEYITHRKNCASILVDHTSHRRSKRVRHYRVA